jgi:hypothetical protein
MPRRNRPRREAAAPPPLRPTGGHAPDWARVEGWSVAMSERGGSVCPYCNQPIAAGRPHVVAWPDDGEDLRKHFHTECFRRELKRGGPAL